MVIFSFDNFFCLFKSKTVTVNANLKFRKDRFSKVTFIVQKYLSHKILTWMVQYQFYQFI